MKTPRARAPETADGALSEPGAKKREQRSKPRRKRVRADEAMVDRGIARDRKHAEGLILSGAAILVDPSGHDRRIEKPGELVRTGSTIRVRGSKNAFVSRAGLKLDRALDAFGVDVSGCICADIGISTGGFTDCLLKRGALRVHGVDVAYGIVAWAIRNDPRVQLYERTNARTLGRRAFGEPIDLGVADVSFISLSLILPPLVDQLAEGGEIVALVKPQFELPKEATVGGIVTDPEARRHGIEKIIEHARAIGLELLHEAASTVPGRDGNVEHFVHLGRERPTVTIPGTAPRS